MFKCNFIWISETYLDSTIFFDSNILGYSLIRADYPSNWKLGSVCIYYKESPAVQTLNNIGLPVCLVCKNCLGNKTGYVRGNSGPNLCLAFGCCSQSFIFFKNLFYQKQWEYGMNIGVAQIRGALI